MKASTAILIALLGLGAYLLYRSLANLQSALGQVGTSLNGELTTFDSALSTLYAEGQSVGSSILSPVKSLSSLGTSAYNGLSSFFSGNGSSSTLSSDLGTNSLFMADGTPIGNLGDNTLTASGDPLNQGLIPVDGGTLNLHLGGALSGTDSNGNYPSDLTDSSPGDGFSGDDGTDGLLDELNFFSGD